MHQNPTCSTSIEVRVGREFFDRLEQSHFFTNCHVFSGRHGHRSQFHFEGQVWISIERFPLLVHFGYFSESVVSFNEAKCKKCEFKWEKQCKSYRNHLSWLSIIHLIFSLLFLLEEKLLPRWHRARFELLTPKDLVCNALSSNLPKDFRKRSCPLSDGSIVEFYLPRDIADSRSVRVKLIHHLCGFISISIDGPWLVLIGLYSLHLAYSVSAFLLLLLLLAMKKYAVLSIAVETGRTWRISIERVVARMRYRQTVLFDDGKVMRAELNWLTDLLRVKFMLKNLYWVWTGSICGQFSNHAKVFIFVSCIFNGERNVMQSLHPSSPVHFIPIVRFTHSAFVCAGEIGNAIALSRLTLLDHTIHYIIEHELSCVTSSDCIYFIGYYMNGVVQTHTGNIIIHFLDVSHSHMPSTIVWVRAYLIATILRAVGAIATTVAAVIARSSIAALR